MSFCFHPNVVKQTSKLVAIANTLALAILYCLCVALFTKGAYAQTRDTIRITGSSTLYPFVTAVAEEFGRSSDYSAPIVEGIGTGGGMKIFCAGIGVQFPDIVNASRQIKRSELEYCVRNGVSEIIEIKVGYDGIVFANTKVSEQLSFSIVEIYLALAKFVPMEAARSRGFNDLEADDNGMVANPFKNWADINPAMPDSVIKVLGPPPTSGTRDTLNERALDAGCNTFSKMREINAKSPDLHRLLCHSIREDGSYIESGENDNIIVQKLQTNYDALGVFGFSFLDQNSDVLQPALIKQGITAIAPSFDTIADTDYPIYRALYFYVKRAHIGVIPGISSYIETFTSEDTWGDYGYLVDRGLIPLNRIERGRFARAASEMTVLNVETILNGTDRTN